MMKHYPLSIFIIIAICYLSFFTPPKTEMDEITNFDKLVHLCMYGGLTVIIWFEYLRRHSRIHWHQLILVGICFPILMSGIVEILQATCTSDRSGDWLDLQQTVPVCCSVVCSAGMSHDG